MGVSSSLFASISGLNSMGEAMSVLGDNVANVNTIAFKSSRTTFQDVLSQSVSTASGSAQVGRGVTLSTVDGLFAQGSFESSTTATDLAIGGQGFFMLRADDSAEAGLFSRAGQFRFDQEGFLVNPVGNFVQGWTIDSTSGEVEGTIGDIQLGKSTPPVATERVDIIVNVDAREMNEATETRLYESWNGTNVAQAIPAAPIDVANYEYSTSVKIYDAKGDSHDLTIYFDRTTQDNEWEFLVTVNPEQDSRLFSQNDTIDDAVVYAPATRYDYVNHPGAGALMYGTIDFSTSGAIDSVYGWEVPPDGRVDHTLNTHRMNLTSTDSYYSFDTNFTGDILNNAQVELNFGARYSGTPTQLNQTLVSDIGAFDSINLSDPITGETTWDTIYDQTGQPFAGGETLAFNGWDNVGIPQTYTYTVVLTDKVSVMLDGIDTNFGSASSIDSQGRLVITDNQNNNPSGLYVEQIYMDPAVNAPGVNPFGTQINISSSKRQIVAPDRGVTTNGGTTPINASTTWDNVYDVAGTGPFDPTSHTITLVGTQPDGDAVTVTYDPAAMLPVPNPNNNVQDFLDAVENAFDAEATIDGAGRLVLADRNADTAGSSGYSSSLAVTSITYGGAGVPAIFGAIVGPAVEFQVINAAGEDGSQMGATVQSRFTPEALTSTQYANSSTTIFQDQDGFASGFLQSVSVDTDGIITGNYSNGQVLQRAQVALATFNNLAGLFKEGGNIFTETTESGAPVTGAPGTNGLGSIAPNALEQSNVDLGNEFVRLITTQRGFQANSKIITTVDEMLNDLINIKR